MLLLLLHLHQRSVRKQRLLRNRLRNLSRGDRNLVHSGFGKGRGSTRPKGYKHRKPRDLHEFLMKNDRRALSLMVGLSIEHLNQVLRETTYLAPIFDEQYPALNHNNKIILALHWLKQYPPLSSLSAMFQIGISLVSSILAQVLPPLADHYRTYIPNALPDNPPSSTLSNLIVAAVDGTLHKVRRPSTGQATDYNGHYKRHGLCTHLLVDFNGQILALKTMIRGKIHDALAASHNDLFRRIMVGKFAIGDTAFSGIDHVVAGFKQKQIKTDAQRIFDTISRQDQGIVERVNGAIKSCVALDKHTSFRHSRDKLLYALFIAAGLHNWKLERQ